MFSSPVTTSHEKSKDPRAALPPTNVPNSQSSDPSGSTTPVYNKIKDTLSSSNTTSKTSRRKSSYIPSPCKVSQAFIPPPPPLRRETKREGVAPKIPQEMANSSKTDKDEEEITDKDLFIGLMLLTKKKIDDFTSWKELYQWFETKLTEHAQFQEKIDQLTAENEKQEIEIKSLKKEMALLKLKKT